MNANRKFEGRIVVADDFFELFGKKMYSNHTFAILCRELLQNSRDATLSGGRIKIDITDADSVSPDGWYRQTIVCDDTGIGMDEETLLDVFLQVGGTLKQDGSVGGFGVAKVALFSCKRGGWSVHTRTSYIDQSLKGEEIKARTGTRVEATACTKERWEKRAAWDAGYMFLQTNNVDNLWVNGRKVRPYKGMRWLGAFYWGDNQYRAEVWTAPRVRHPSGVYYIDNRIIWRINGLTQFVDSLGEDIGSNIIVEFTGLDYKPRGDHYPFNMSREGTSNWEIQDQVKALVRPLMRSRNSSKERAKQDEERAVKGKKPRADRIKTAEAGYLLLNQPSHFDAQTRKAHRQITALWTAIVKLHDPDALSGQCFGAMGACRMMHEEKPAYLLNPEVFALEWEHGDNPLAVCIALWHLATHEYTHDKTHDHDEEFTSLMFDYGCLKNIMPFVEAIGPLRIIARKALDSIAYIREKNRAELYGGLIAGE